MDSFFESIRGYFKSEYHGRYFSVMLRELAQHEPESFALLIDQIAESSKLRFWKDLSKDLKNGELAVTCEYSFQVTSKKRRADLAVLCEKSPVVLVEVKEFDHLAPGTLDQLIDYLSSVSGEKGFIHVHRFLPPPEQRKQIDDKYRKGLPVAMLSYDQIYKALKDSKKERRALGALICDYLEGIGVGIHREVKADDNALKFLMVQMLGFPHAAKMGRMQGKDTVRRGPDLLTALLANVEVVGEWVRHPNSEVMPMRCTTRFWVEPWLDHKKVRKKIADSGDIIDCLPNGIEKYVEEGVLRIQALASLRGQRMAKDDRLYLTLGYGVHLKKGASEAECFAYTEFYSNLFGGDTYEWKKFSNGIPKEQSTFDAFKVCLQESKREGLKLASGSSKMLLQRLQIPD